MKEVGVISWNSPNADATNTSLFTGLPGGRRTDSGNFYNNGNHGFWWSSSEYSKLNALCLGLDFDLGSSGRQNGNMGSGASIRCIRD